MGLVLTKHSGKVLFGIWKIEETVEQLIAHLSLSKDERARLIDMHHGLRKKHWLAARVLLNKLNPDHPNLITYDQHGKPGLKAMHVSYSHSRDMVAMILSPDKSVGIDIEFTDRDLQPIKHKYINKLEEEEMRGKNEKNLMYIVWCSKEVLYKIWGRGGLDFKKDLNISGLQDSKQGKLKGIITVNSKCFYVPLNFVNMNEYMLVYGSTGEKMDS